MSPVNGVPSQDFSPCPFCGGPLFPTRRIPLASQPQYEIVYLTCSDCKIDVPELETRVLAPTKQSLD